ncbi:unnamed protein product [[Actinomadura] parvosata subsp. kistnae]|uniref:WD40 repeat domain-containing protein n=1 Tax=[Actinomadura] parvosata subsp. kistnae TaxID=1909395 RepID=A0A1V0AD25_9ACTN|nr:hypothetical protein [Nonomuraea sp. ATCC 55076]AQZ68124.1 hypothetical protein BKM31_47635 [Nonomuraea sp. ATCC 55076]SPL93490.1 unnamed protein product [Actinomadura parvosata subsp. kistnae]
MTRLLRDTLEDWAGEARVPPGLADRALRRRAWKPYGAAVLVAAMIAAVAVFVTVQRDPVPPVARPLSGITLPPRPSPAPTDIRTDTEHSPPAKLVAAGRMAVSAYYVTRQEPVEGDRTRVRRTWSVYDPGTDGYRETPYAWVDVAPGLQVAAVIQGDLIGNRVGVLNLDTGQMLATYELEHPVGSVVWSPDGTRILATAYSSYPDVFQEDSAEMGSPRTGYYVIDTGTGESVYHELPPLPDGIYSDAEYTNGNGRQDLGWSLDGELIWGPTSSSPDRRFYTLDGSPTDAPKGERYRRGSGLSATSPDGQLVLGDDGMPTKITEAATGKVVGRQRVLQLHAWADNDNVLALGCAGKCENEFNNGLVLVSVDGSKTIQLAANRDSDADGSWRWVLTPR